MSKSLGNSVEPQEVTRAERRRDPAPVGGPVRLCRGPADRPDDPADDHRRLSQAAQHHSLSAGRPGRLRRGRAGRGRRTCRRWSASFSHRLWELDGQVRAAYQAYRLRRGGPAPWRTSAPTTFRRLFFDIRRDALYCDRPDSPRRRACRTVMDARLRAADRVARPRPSLHHGGGVGGALPRRRLEQRCASFPTTPDDWRNDAEAERWRAGRAGHPRRHRRAGDRAARQAHGRPLEAAPVVHLADPALLAAFDGLDAGGGVPHQPGEAARRRRAGATPSASRASPAWPSSPGGPRAASARAPGASCRRWGPIRAIPIFRCATPTRSPGGTPCTA